jgi:hypothetical protein
MIDLPDAIVRLALADGQHLHHLAPQSYWTTEAAHIVGFTRTTMMGFLRLNARPDAPG